MTTFDATRALELADEADKADEYDSVHLVDPMADMLRAAVGEVERLRTSYDAKEGTCNHDFQSVSRTWDECTKCGKRE